MAADSRLADSQADFMAAGYWVDSMEQDRCLADFMAVEATRLAEDFMAAAFLAVVGFTAAAGFWAVADFTAAAGFWVDSQEASMAVEAIRLAAAFTAAAAFTGAAPRIAAYLGSTSHNNEYLSSG